MSNTMIDADDPDVVVIYTDGSAYPNPNGDGGWAFYCTFKGKDAIRYGSARMTTNNAMELEAIRHALLYVPMGKKFDYPILIFTDSQYSKNALTKWVHGWEDRQWTTASGAPVRNRGIIEPTFKRITAMQEHRTVEIRWVMGHAGIPENELVDQRAGYARKQKVTNWTASDPKQ